MLSLVGITRSSSPVLFLIVLCFMVLYYFFLNPIKKNIGGIRKEVKLVKSEVANIYNATRETQKCIKENFKTELMHDLPNKSSWASSNSPLQLNEKGGELLNISGAKEFIDKNIAVLLEKIKNKTLVAEYDVERESFTLLLESINQDNEFDKKIKKFLYNNPQFDGKNIDFRDIIFVGAIYIRDKYLEKYPFAK